ncbi:hypothetical protein NC653_020619, partial [Populus alba x Populus x berolinensis]
PVQKQNTPPPPVLLLIHLPLHNPRHQPPSTPRHRPTPISYQAPPSTAQRPSATTIKASSRGLRPSFKLRSPDQYSVERKKKIEGDPSVISSTLFLSFNFSFSFKKTSMLFNFLILQFPHLNPFCYEVLCRKKKEDRGRPICDFNKQSL